MLKTKLSRILLAVMVLVAGVAVYFFRFSPKAQKAAHLAKGERYYAAGEYDKARLEFANVLKVEPANPIAIERMGSIWLKQGVPSMGLPYLMRLRSLTPANRANNEAIPSTLFAMGEMAFARKEAVDLLKSDPSNGPAWMCLAETAITPEEIGEAQGRLKSISSLSPPQHYAAAVYALRRQELDEAENHLDAALKADPSMYRGHLTMGDLYILRLNRVGSAERIKKASEVAPPRTREKYRFAEYEAQAGRFDEAVKIVKSHLEQTPDFVPGWIILSQILVSKGDYAGGLDVLKNVFSRDPTNYEGRMVQSQVQLAKNDAKGAIATLEPLVKEYPKSPLAKLRLAKAYAMLDRWGDVQAPLRQALILSPRLSEAQVLLAEADLRSGKAQEVVDLLSDVLRQQPALPKAGLLLGDAYRMLKRFDKAVEIYRRHAAAFPKDVTSRVLLGVSLRALEKKAEARAAFEQALDRLPDNLVIIGHLVELDCELKEFALAKTRLLGLSGDAAKTAGARLIEARIALAEKDWTKAEELLLSAVDGNPDLDAAYRFLLNLYVENDRVEAGIKKMEDRLAQNSEDVGAHQLIAFLSNHLQQYDRAQREYEWVVAKKPNSIFALNNLAYLLSTKRENLPKAAELAEKALAIQPANLAVADTLGWIRYRRGDFEGALSLLRECATKLAAEGEVPGVVNYHLALASAATGNFSQARTALEKAVQSADSFEGKEKIPVRLRILADDAAALPLEELVKLEKESPSDPTVKLRLGDALERAGKWAEAIPVYEGALQANPKLGLAAARLARVHSMSEAGKAKALEYAKKARALSPSDPLVAGVIGVAVARAGDTAWAYGLLQEVALRADGPTLLEFAKVAYRLGKTAEAVEALERAKSKELGDAKAFVESYARMVSLATRDTVTDVEAGEASEIVKSDPGNLPARVVAAAALQAKLAFKEAAQAYEKILQDEPGFPIAEARLAWLNLELGDWKRAHELATSARKMMPSDSVTAIVLGETSLKKKEYSRATEYLQEAGRAKPLDAKRLFLLGTAYLEAKNKPAAEDTLKKAVAAGLKETDLAEAERMLKQIRP